ncbi:MAG: regulatory iron-sulfur-containing complex subunit RicT [Desulfotalea sp.]
MAKQETQNQQNRRYSVDKTEDSFGLICPVGALFYRVSFRDGGQQFTAFAMVDDLQKGDLVLVKQEQDVEPAIIVGRAAQCGCKDFDHRVLYEIAGKGNKEDYEKYASLLVQEKKAFGFCTKRVARIGLKMCLVRVEKFFNGSKMIFYFTAENRVDFRELVKELVQEFRTRVEMRQVGVRHETKMVGGIGTCGRELCCSSFIRKFDSVSIKMAKEQDLPLNPTKISGVCNRLLCCLTYEYETYRSLRKSMPKPGKTLNVNGQQLRVRRQNIMHNTVLTNNRDGDEIILTEEEWIKAMPQPKPESNSNKGRSKEGRKFRSAQGDGKQTKSEKKESKNNKEK